MSKVSKRGILFALIAAILYAINAPFSKLLLDFVPSTLMAGFLYLGAGCGIGFLSLFRNKTPEQKIEGKFAKKEKPFVVGMILLDIVAPIFLLLGLKFTTAANASLLNNFEIVATALIAFIIFKEKISIRLWVGIVFVVFSCLILSFKDITSLQFSYGSLFVILACLCWGIENNCTKKISNKDPMKIVVLKGFFSGLGSIIIGLCIGERITYLWSVFAVMGVGFVAYGLSILFYVYAQRFLGAARTSSYYAIAPFVGAILSLIIFKDLPNFTFYIALGLMIIGAWFCSQE